MGRFKKCFSNVLRDLSIKKYLYYRELNPMDRIYDIFHLSLLCYGSQNGKALFFDIPQVISDRGLLYLVFHLLHCFIALFSSICVAEMAALMPSTGGIYHYCYHSIGEFIAFLAGWNMIFGMVGITLNKGTSMRIFLDTYVFGSWMEDNLNFLPRFNVFNIFTFDGIIDFVVPCIYLLLAVMSTAFVKNTKYAYTASVCFFFGVIFFITLIFTFYLDINNPFIVKKDKRRFAGSAMRSAEEATFGYEVVAILGEETKNPTFTIPGSILNSVRMTIFVSIIYSFIITLVWSGEVKSYLWPYEAICMQLGLPHLHWVPFVAAVFGMFCSLYSTFLTLTRLIYAMSRDGMICNIFSKVGRKTLAPFLPAMIIAILLSFLGLFFARLKASKEIFLSLYITKMVTYAVLLFIRYKCFIIEEEDRGDRWILLNWPRSQARPTPITQEVSVLLICSLFISAFGFTDSLVMLLYTKKSRREWTVFFCLALLISYFFLSRQPQNDRSDIKFAVPEVPLFPTIAIISDYLLAFSLFHTVPGQTYRLLSGWFVIGIIVYFAFSRYNSVERRMRYPDGRVWSIFNLRTENLGRVDMT